MNRIDYLDGIRAMAIGAVLVVHWVASQAPIAYGGYIGVDIFFVLSGYIITTMLWRKRPIGSIGRRYATFLKRRVKRLYPALLGFVVITLVVYALFPGAPWSVEDLLVPAAMALGQTYSFFAASELVAATPFAITWSLSVEWMFYLLWPLIVLLLKDAGIGPRRVAAWAATAAGGLYMLSLLQNEHWFYYGPVARVAEIVIGGVLALLFAMPRETPESGRPRLAAAAAILSVLFIAVYTVAGPVQFSPVFRFLGLPLTVASTLCLIWYGARFPNAGVTRLLGWKPLAFMGRISYSLYLWHMVGLNLFTRDNMGNMPLPVIAALAVLLSVIAAGLSYRFLELPFMKSQGKVLQSAAESIAPVPART